jgi:hypothetical protein
MVSERCQFLASDADSAINSFHTCLLSPASLKPVSSVIVVLRCFVAFHLFSTTRRSDLIVLTYTSLADTLPTLVTLRACMQTRQSPWSA